MRLQVLMDNNTFIDQYYMGEPAVSYYIETDDSRILFDTGYSDAFLANARAMDVDLSSLTHVVLSHGHNDHTGGFRWLKDQVDLADVEIVAHPDCFRRKVAGGVYIGAPVDAQEIGKIGRYRPCTVPYALSNNCVFLGQIPRLNDFEARNPIGVQVDGESEDPDYVLDDSALVYQSDEGLFIVTGCSHSGICNIVDYAMKICRDERILGIIGGFHLFEEDARLDRTIQYLGSLDIAKLYPCHCVSFKVKARMNQSLAVSEAGVGMSLNL